MFWPAMIIFMVAAAVVVWGVSSFGSMDKQPDKIVKQKTEEYDRERITKLKIPKKIPQKVFATKPVAEPVPAAVVAPATNPAPEIDHVAMAKKQRELEKRWAAPLVIYDNLDKKDSEGVAVQKTQEKKLSSLDRLQEQLLSQVTGTVGNTTTGPGLLMHNPEKVQRVKGYAKASLISPEQQRYTVTEGTMIGAVLETAIQSNLAGKLRASVDEDIYSFDGRTLLIEKGSTLIGEYQTGLKQGQVRLFAIWDRMITPYGVDVELRSPGTDQLGRSGLSGWVDTHFWQRFGSSMMLSIIGAYTAREASKDSESSQMIAQSVSENFNKSSEIALENSINIPPTLHKNQGDLIKVFVARDINFKQAYLLSQKQRRADAK